MGLLWAKTFEKYIDERSNVNFIDIICFECIFEFDKLIEWLYVPNEEFQSGRSVGVFQSLDQKTYEKTSAGRNAEAGRSNKKWYMDCIALREGSLTCVQDKRTVEE